MKHSIITMISDLNRSLAHDFRVTPVHAPDAPIFLAVAWPTEEGTTGLKPRLPAGRGITLAQAMRSAGAEAMELRASLAQNHRAQIANLLRVEGRAMVRARDLLSDEPVLLPAQMVYLDFAHVSGEPVYADADSTGCATGASRPDAALRALLECLERDAMALWWHGGLRPGVLPLDLIDGAQPRLVWWLQERARQTRLLNLTTDTGVAVVAAVSSDATGRNLATGTAAHSNLADAALNATTEMLQSEAALAQAAAAHDPEYLHWLDHADMTAMPQFHALPDKPAPGVMDMGDILQRLSDLGHRAFAVDMTLPGDPQPTLRVVVPGLCAMRGQIDVPRFTRLTGHPPDLSTTVTEPY